MTKFWVHWELSRWIHTCMRDSDDTRFGKFWLISCINLSGSDALIMRWVAWYPKSAFLEYLNQKMITREKSITRKLNGHPKRPNSSHGRWCILLRHEWISHLWAPTHSLNQQRQRIASDLGRSSTLLSTLASGPASHTTDLLWEAISGLKNKIPKLLPGTTNN